MKEFFFQKSNFRCRENIYICRPLRRLRRLAIEYVKKYFLLLNIKQNSAEYKIETTCAEGTIILVVQILNIRNIPEK